MSIPRIAIPEIDQDMKNYAAAALAAGMDPVIVKELPGSVDDFDGLLIPGGVDIDPARYGHENLGSVGIREDLDELQFTILDAFVKQKKPVFGICRGHQVINVYFGGTMIQHLPSADLHAKPAGTPDKVNECVCKEDSWLAGIYGKEFPHNSAHHQAVNELGAGLVSDSFCQADGVVEAIHHDSLPVYSVQWHPERMCLDHERPDTVNGLPVLEFFGKICRNYKEQKMK